MPRVISVIPETQLAITRPVALAVIRQVGKLLSLPKSTSILYPGSSESAAQTGSTLNYEGEASSFPYYGKLHIEANESYIDDRVLTDIAYRHEFLPVFLDKDLGVRFQPIYSATELVLNFVYRAPDQNAANRFRDDIKMRVSALRAENLHELTYNYNIPRKYVEMLQMIYGLRQAQAPYDDTFEKWLRACFDPRVTNITTLIGTEPHLAIPEHQIRNLGHFDFTAAPDVQTKDSEAGTYNISFDYRITYDKVVGIMAEYPLVVHNQMIPGKWHGYRNASGDLPSDPGRKRRVSSVSVRAFDAITQPYRVENHRPIDGVCSPQFDDWIPDTVHPDTSTVFTGIIQVDPADRTDVLNLQELGDWALDPDVLAFLKTEYPYITTYGKSIFYASLYNAGVPLTDGPLVCDKFLHLRYAPSMNLRHRYHLRLALVNDLFIMDRPAWERFRSSGISAQRILAALQGRFNIQDAWVPPLQANRYIRYADLVKVAHRLNAHKAPYQTGVEYAMMTVGNYIIAAHRSNPDATHQTDGRRAVAD